MPIIIAPYRYTSGRLPAPMPLSMMDAVTYGISTPMITSRVVHSGVSKAAALYCLTCLRMVLNMSAKIAKKCYRSARIYGLLFV